MNAHAIIHIGIKQLGIEGEDRRDLYERVTGERSLTGMSDAQRRAVVDELKRLGFTPRPRGGQKEGQKGGPAKRRPTSKKAYVRLIFALWRSLGELGAIETPGPKGLRAFVEKRTGVADPDWLTFDQASPVIEALKAMEARAKAERGDAA